MGRPSFPLRHPSDQGWHLASGVRRLSSPLRRPSDQGWRLASGIRRLSSSRRLSSGFTLMELLVVISIIAILLGIIMPSYLSIQKKAKYTKDKVTTKNLENAFKAYLDYYRAWPASGAFGTPSAAHQIDTTVVNILQGQDIINNADGIVFYEFETNSIANGNGMLDAWSTPNDSTKWWYYQFQVDAYDNKITWNGQSLNRSVIVWSWGADHSNNTPDDVKSWD